MPELTGDALDRIQNDLEPVPVAEWGPPSDVTGFLRWLAAAVPGANSHERLATFMTYPAAAKMPASLRADLEEAELL